MASEHSDNELTEPEINATAADSAAEATDAAPEVATATTETAATANEHTSAELSIEQLQADLDAAHAQMAEHRDQVLRARAELENARKRNQRDIEKARKYALEEIAAALLEVRDSMELGLNAAQQESADVASLREGMGLTLKLLQQLMDKFHIQPIDPVQQAFNPELHQALTMQESDKLAPNTVISVMQKGYQLKDRLLRPALVTVSKAPQKTDKSA